MHVFVITVFGWIQGKTVCKFKRVKKKNKKTMGQKQPCIHTDTYDYALVV